MKYQEQEYEIICGSDVINDGMYLELSKIDEKSSLLLYAFWSDATQEFLFSAYQGNLPFGLVELFVAEARKRLPSVNLL